MPTPVATEAAPVATAVAPGTRRGSLIGLLVVVAVAAAVIGFLVAPGSSKSPKKQAALSGNVSSGPVSVNFPATWRRSAAVASTAATLGLIHPVAVSPTVSGSAGAVVIGTAGPVGASLLPPAFKAKVGSVPPAQLVKLGSHTFKRYLDVVPNGSSNPVSVYALATTAGTGVAACVVPQVGGTAFSAMCERVIATLKMSGSVLPLGANPTYAKSLGAIIAKLDSARTIDGRQLSTAKKERDQAAAAGRLAQAYAQAAGATAKLNTGPVGEGINPRIAAALRSLGSGYRSLSAAARANNKGGYAAAQKSIASADAALGRSLAALRQSGYVIG
jgi:hypothetical protein